MEPAQRREIVGVGRAGLWPAFRLSGVVVLDDVVDVATPRRATAPREHARPVAEDHVLTDPVRDLIARRGLLLVEVDDRLDRDLRPRVGTPGPELVEQDESLALLEPPGGSEDRGDLAIAVDGGGGVEVGVEHDLAGGGEAWSRYAGSFLTGRSTTNRLTGRPTTSSVVQVERGLRAGQVTEGLGPPRIERLLRSRGP